MVRKVQEPKIKKKKISQHSQYIVPMNKCHFKVMHKDKKIIKYPTLINVTFH